MKKKNNFFIILILNVLIGDLRSNSNYYQNEISNLYLKERDLQSYNFISSAFYQEDNDFLNSENFKFIFNIIPFYYKSDKNDKYDHSFLIDRKSNLKISGDNFTNIKDLRAEYFDLLPSTNCFLDSKLEETSCGARIDLKASLQSLFHSDFFSNWIFGFKTVLNRKKQKCSFSYSGLDKNEKKLIENFFSNKTEFSKVNNQDMSEIGLESLAFTLGGIYLSKNKKFNIYYYGGFEIPTGQILNQNSLYYPTIGNNGHLGLIMGAHFRLDLFKNNFNFGIFSELENRFKFYRSQQLTFDLYGKPWSRYLPVINKNNQSENKLLNSVSTLNARVHPCNNIDISIGTFLKKELKDSILNLYLGYNIWIAQNEYIELMDRNNKNEYNNFYNYGIKGSSNLKTSSKSTISKLEADDINFINFKINNLDLASVAKNGGFSQSLFLKLNFESETLLTSIGAWKEFGHNYIQSRTGFWFGFGIQW